MEPFSPSRKGLSSRKLVLRNPTIDPSNYGPSNYAPRVTSVPSLRLGGKSVNCFHITYVVVVVVDYDELKSLWSMSLVVHKHQCMSQWLQLLRFGLQLFCQLELATTAFDVFIIPSLHSVCARDHYGRLLGLS